MARYTGPVCRLCRREGQKLFLKGERCYSEKCSIGRREYAPGQHGQGRKKVSEYGMHLRAKQRARRYYGVNEVQFSHYFEMAKRKVGVTGDNLLRILESRLDNVVFRLGLSNTRRESRQLVNHGHILVNGKKVDIPSYRVKVGDVITLKEKTQGSDMMKAIVEANSSRIVPKWLDMDKNTLTGKVIALAQRDDIDFEVEEHLIVELYSK